ncbi:MAG: hypothetical protein ACP5KN_19380 [Armatimonadota bacterium]
MADTTITIDQELYQKLNEYAEAAGYDSGEEFAAVILQREIDKLDDADATEKIEDRLRGLGYIS